MRQDKRQRALSAYNGHKGQTTLAHVERNLLSAFPTAQEELTGLQYGKVMSVANTSFQDGKNSNKADMWAYDGESDWLLGIRGTDIIIEMRPDNTIVIQRGQDNSKTVIYYAPKI